MQILLAGETFFFLSFFFLMRNEKQIKDKIKKTWHLGIHKYVFTKPNKTQLLFDLSHSDNVERFDQSFSHNTVIM